MGAIVVHGVSAREWASLKPANYKDQDLDKALKAYEPLAGKGISIPGNLFPDLPKATIGEIDTCIKGLQSAITELQKGQTFLKQIVAALQAVAGAAGKTSADLRKLAKGKDADKNACEKAAISAGSIGSFAASAIKNFQ